ncbi:unnamed protein product, partial [Urochloa humidicola]
SRYSLFPLPSFPSCLILPPSNHAHAAASSSNPSASRPSTTGVRRRFRSVRLHEPHPSAIPHRCRTSRGRRRHTRGCPSTSTSPSSPGIDTAVSARSGGGEALLAPSASWRGSWRRGQAFLRRPQPPMRASATARSIGGSGYRSSVEAHNHGSGRGVVGARRGLDRPAVEASSRHDARRRQRRGGGGASLAAFGPGSSTVPGRRARGTGFAAPEGQGLMLAAATTHCSTHRRKFRI